MNTTVVRNPATGFAAGSNVTAAAAEFVIKAWATMQRAHQAMKARRHLAAMPDHILKDIGIGRSEIEAVTAGLAEASHRARIHGPFA